MPRVRNELTTLHSSINSIKILYDHLLSDHHPLTVCFNCHSLPKFHQFQFHDSNPCAHWKTASGSQLLKYCKESACSLSRVVLPVDAILCTNVMCSEPAHRKRIEDFYNSIVSALSSACSVSLIGHKNTNLNPFWAGITLQRSFMLLQEMLTKSG